MKSWNGSGWYFIGFSDGGQAWTNDGPVYFECELDLEDEISSAREQETEFHLVSVEFCGDGEEPIF